MKRKTVSKGMEKELKEKDRKNIFVIDPPEKTIDVVKLLLKVKHKMFRGHDEFSVELPGIHPFVENFDVSDENNWQCGLNDDGELFLSKYKHLEELAQIELGLIDPKQFFDDKQFITKRVGDFIMKFNEIKTLVGSKEIYYYENGLYNSNGEEFIKSRCADLLHEKFCVHYANETIEYIRAKTYVDPNDVNNGWINLENGLLNPLSMEFKKHSPDIFSIVRIPIRYDANADCPLFKQKLKEKVDNKVYTEIQEMFGYGFLPGQKYERAFLLYGPPRTMKSTTLFVLGELIGEENITAYPLQQLTEDPFSIAYLYGMTANICADLTSKALRDTGKFMIITGGDKLTAGKKGQHHKTWYPSTKLIFSCNVIPATTNKNLAFYRRWKILKFPNQTPSDHVDNDMKEKLKDELPGILNWALEGLERLEANKKFSYDLTDEEIKDLYERSSDTIQSFIFNEIDTENDEGSLTKREVFKHYLEYCDENELQAENVIKFGRMFIALTGCGTGRKGSRGQQIPSYQGVNWKEENSMKSQLKLNVDEGKEEKL